MARPYRILIALLTVGVVSGCTHERADLEVSLTPPVASRFLVSGNCFAGWYVAFDVLIAETRGVDVAIESVSLRVDDPTGSLLGERTVDATFLRDRLGESGALLRGHTSVRIPMSVGALKGSVDAPAISTSIVASGDVLASDERGPVRSSYRIPAVVAIEDLPLPASGACNTSGQGR
jgi:hypothetical protein